MRWDTQTVLMGSTALKMTLGQWFYRVFAIVSVTAEPEDAPSLYGSCQSWIYAQVVGLKVSKTLFSSCTKAQDQAIYVYVEHALCCARDF